MIKVKNIILLLLCFCIKFAFAQYRSHQYNYHAPQRNKDNKNIIRHNLCTIHNQTYSGRNLNIMYYSDQCTSTDILLPDSLCGPFVITRIVEKKDNFILKRKLAKQVIYMVDVRRITQERSPNFICVIIPRETSQNRVFNVGDTLKVTIYPLFWRDKFLHKQGDTIYSSLPSLKTPISFVFRNIWIENLQGTYRNYFFIQSHINPQSIIARRKHN